ncbi:MAG: TonB-dependent receptor [Arcobacteraceae bacterium]|nr:TonB-dependent receptor [Arcobacteraceae bacterium]
MKKMSMEKCIAVSLIVSSVLYANQTVTLDEVMVNANKIEENIKDVPQSITVISEEELEEKGIKKVADIIKEIPNMNISDSMSGGISSFRGLNSSMFTNNNPIVIYVDGVPYYDRFDFNPSLANVEQIEVLRGPQGTLYGKDAIGAVINIITKTPSNEWKGKVGLEYGNYNYGKTTFYASGALIDNKLFAGINGSYKSDDGWITNHYTGMDKNANKKKDRKTSAFLLYKPTDALSAKLTLTDNYEKKYFFDGISTNGTPSVNNLKRDTAKDASFDVPTWERTLVKSQALNVSYDFENMKLESTTTHKKLDFDGDYDSDYRSNTVDDGLNQFNYTQTDTWTQEFKLSGKNQNIKWVTGFYFDKEKREQGPYGQQMDYFGALYYANSNSVTEGKAQAVFGQTMFPLSESLELTLGARYQKIQKEMAADVLNTWGGATMAEFRYTDEKTWNTFLPKIALSWAINDNTTTYTSISKGYMPGGFNYFPSTNVSSDNTFEAQKSVNYEIGLKYQGQQYALNVALFRMNIEDIHIYKTVGANFLTDNAKKAHTQGIEFDGKYYLTENIELSGALGLIEAKYDDYDNGTRKYDGERIESTPRYTANLGVAYFGDNGMYGRVDFNARGNTNYFDGANEQIVETEGAIISNAKIGYKIGDWDIYSYITNITDEEYITFYQSKTGLSMAGFNEPRRFGVGAIYKF